MLHEQATTAVTSMLSSSTARRCHTSVLLQEQRDETGPPSHVFKKDATSWAISERRQMETEASVHEDKNPGNSYELVQDFERQLLHWPGLWQLFPSLQTGKDTSSPLTMQPVTTHKWSMGWP